MAKETENNTSQEENDNMADVEFGEIKDSGNEELLSSKNRKRNLEMLYDIPLTVSVRLGEAEMPIKELLTLGAGAVIELDKFAGESVDLLVNGLLVGKGEVVVVNENFGLRITDIVSPEERLKGL